MSAVDITIVILILITGINGYLKGFIEEFFGVIGFIFGLWAAIHYTNPLALRFFSDSEYFNVIYLVIFLIVFTALVVSVSFVAKWIKNSVHLTFLGVFDKILGVVFSILKWLLISSVLIWFLDSVDFQIPTSITKNSKFFPYLVGFAPSFFTLLSSILPFFQDIFDQINDIKQHEYFV